jgi:alkylhydroperoxidase/carboxymuconolactone decarboxylase family protein YurZ
MPENPLNTVARIDPKLVEHMRNADAWAFADGALPRKMKLLIAIAYDAAHGAANGVRSLARQAIDAGATKEEIGEALRVWPRGGMAASRGLCVAGRGSGYEGAGLFVCGGAAAGV